MRARPTSPSEALVAYRARREDDRDPRWFVRYLSKTLANSRRPPSPSELPPELSGAIVGPDTPAPEAPATPRATPQPVARGPKEDAATVLIVEDDESIRTLVIRALGTQYTVYEATDGQ